MEGQTEITRPIQLLDTRGNLRRPGYSKTMVQEYRRSDVKALAGKLAEELVKTCYLPSEIASALALSVLLVATRFVDEVCGRCPVRCIDETARLVREPYFAPHHPAKKR